MFVFFIFQKCLHFPNISVFYIFKIIFFLYFYLILHFTFFIHVFCILRYLFHKPIFTFILHIFSYIFFQFGKILFEKNFVFSSVCHLIFRTYHVTLIKRTLLKNKNKLAPHPRKTKTKKIININNVKNNANK